MQRVPHHVRDGCELDHACIEQWPRAIVVSDCNFREYSRAEDVLLRFGIDEGRLDSSATPSTPTPSPMPTMSRSTAKPARATPASSGSKARSIGDFMHFRFVN
jgi:hypothetical protein